MARKKFVKQHVKREQKSSIEPALENLSRTDFIHVLYWYNYRDYPEETRKKWVIEYTKNQDLKNVDAKYFIPTLSTLCRIAHRGFELTEDHQEYIDDKVNKLVSEQSDTQKQDKKKQNGPSVQERIYNQASIVMGEIDYFVDEAFQGRFNKLDSLINEFGQHHLKHVTKHIQSYIDDFNNNPKDYDFISTQKRNKIVKWLESLKTECNNLLQAKKKARKPRTPKKKSPVELCKNVKISDDTRVTPPKLIGNSYAVLYNEKYNKLHFLVAEDIDGFTVQGTTIKNVSEMKSKLFTVKNKNVLDELPSSINKLKRFIDEDKQLKLSKGKVSTRMSNNVSIIVVL